MTKVKRKYDDDYLNYGFIFVDKGNEQLPQCVICLKTFSNASMKPYQLKQHQVKVHSQLAEKNRSYFELKAHQVKKMRLDTTGQFQTTSKAMLTASYEVSLQVAKAKKPYNIAETLIKPCLVECATILLDSNAVSKIKQVSLSNDTIKSRIDDMACNIKSKLIANIKASPVFAIQLDESVDVANLSQLMVFVRYVHNQAIEEDFLFCRPLETTTKASDVFKLVEEFFETEKLDWNKLVGVCTDGAPAMLGARSGFVELVKRKNPNIIATHCIIHREALASRTMPEELKQTLDSAIKILNYIKASALNSRLFRRLCQDMESEHQNLVYHTSVRWLSKGNMLNRLVLLLQEVIEFLEIQKKRELKSIITDSIFQKRLAYLADIFGHLNELNRKLQGMDSNIIVQRDKIAAFIAKLELWKGKIQSGGSVASFPTLHKMFGMTGISSVIQSDVVEHLDKLTCEFHRYFPSIEDDTPTMALTRNPFRFPVAGVQDDEENTQEQFLEMIHDSAAKASFEDNTLGKFWAIMINIYPKVAAKPLSLLTAFSSTYLCESAFSNVVTIKTKARNSMLNLESDLRCAISKLKPDIKLIVAEKQQQKSH